MKARQLVASVTLALIVLIAMVSPVFAIANPDGITFGTGSEEMYEAFYNVYETGDMLFIAEYDLDYASAPTDYDADEAFFFEVLNVAGDTVLLSAPVPAYQNNIISIYQTAAQVTAASYATGTAYQYRVTGNPVIFATLTEGTNMVTRTLDAGADWIDQSTATAISDPLRIFCIDVATNLEAHDSATYIVTIQGIDYINSDGRDIFLAGIPSLSSFVTNLFQTGVVPMTADEPTSTGTYASTLSITNKLGASISGGFTNLGNWMGISQALAASLFLTIAMTILFFWLYQKTGNPIVVLVYGPILPLFGTYLGLIPLAIAFIVTLIVIMLLGYYFLTRGTL